MLDRKLVIVCLFLSFTLILASAQDGQNNNQNLEANIPLQPGLSVTKKHRKRSYKRNCVLWVRHRSRRNCAQV